MDAAWKDSSSSTGVGIICRNEAGAAMAAKALALDVNFGAPLAELKVIHEGIVFAISMGFPQVVVKSDSHLAIDFFIKKIKTMDGSGISA